MSPEVKPKPLNRLLVGACSSGNNYTFYENAFRHFKFLVSRWFHFLVILFATSYLTL